VILPPLVFPGEIKRERERERERGREREKEGGRERCRIVQNC
jgi:hypothetical protein